jgi:Protein of unknown function (DUF3486)
MARKGRGRLNSLQLLPPEVNHIVRWADAELQASQRSQLDIYQEFTQKLTEAIREARGELDFKIPSFSAFNRYSIGLDAMTRELNETREMASAIAGTFDPGESDDLTLIAVETIKSAIFTMMRSRSGKLDTKDLKQLSDALRSALTAQNISTTRRQKVEAEFKQQAEAAVSKVAKAKGLTAETTQEILSQILGVKT